MRTNNEYHIEHITCLTNESTKNKTLLIFKQDVYILCKRYQYVSPPISTQYCCWSSFLHTMCFCSMAPPGAGLGYGDFLCPILRKVAPGGWERELFACGEFSLYLGYFLYRWDTSMIFLLFGSLIWNWLRNFLTR